MCAAGDGTRLSASKNDDCLSADDDEKDDEDGLSISTLSLKFDSAEILERDMGFSGC